MRGTFDNQPGPVSEAYAHWYCDDEIIFTGIERGAYAYAEDSHVKHLHPMVGLAPDDATYRKGLAHRRSDRHTFALRMHELGNNTTVRARLRQPTPTDELTVICGTFGDKKWVDLAHSRALPSAKALGVPVIHYHGNNVAHARNLALSRVETPLVVCLDADDELEPGFVEAVAQSTADVRVPRVRCMRDGQMVAGGLFMPKIGDPAHRRGDHECSAECLPFGNWIVVGAAARTQLLRDVGGWAEWIPIYEDWHLWAKCHRAGATFEPCPNAIYRQHLSHDSRNHIGEAFDRRFYWHERIAHDVWPERFPHPDAHVV